MIVSVEQCSKPWLVDDYRGIRLPNILGISGNPNNTNQYNGMTEGF
jgi:hypothetical protein